MKSKLQILMLSVLVASSAFFTGCKSGVSFTQRHYTKGYHFDMAKADKQTKGAKVNNVNEEATKTLKASNTELAVSAKETNSQPKVETASKKEEMKNQVVDNAITASTAATPVISKKESKKVGNTLGATSNSSSIKTIQNIAKAIKYGNFKAAKKNWRKGIDTTMDVLGLIALILGVLGLIFTLVSFGLPGAGLGLGFVFSLAALIMGLISRKDGSELGKWGFILGLIGLILWLIVLILVLVLIVAVAATVV